MADKYYRALILAPSERFLPLLDLMGQEGPAALTEEAFRRAVGETDQPNEGGEVYVPEPIGDAPVSPEEYRMAMPHTSAQVVLWDRVIVDEGSGTPEAEVYLTGLQDGNAQSGFTPCPAMGSCRWMMTHLAESKKAYCAHMYVWFLHSLSNPPPIRDAHMKSEPASEHVLSKVETIRMRPV